MKDQSQQEKVRELKIHIGMKIFSSIPLIPLIPLLIHLFYLGLIRNDSLYEQLLGILLIVWAIKALHGIWTWNIKFDIANNRIIIQKIFGKKIINTHNVTAWTLEEGIMKRGCAGGFFICKLKDNRTITYPIVDEYLTSQTYENTFKPLFEKILGSSKYVPPLTSSSLRAILWYFWV